MISILKDNRSELVPLQIYRETGLRCCSFMEFHGWWTMAKRADYYSHRDHSAVITVRSFCSDCLPEIRAQMHAEGRCIRNGKPVPGGK